ncbi:MAG: hypothetical protein LJE70_12115 [Chromatiaceae bacterium]|jgi:hypothetical protein|nr:hypothetical protein [Chromatiaceae bacterium]
MTCVEVYYSVITIPHGKAECAYFREPEGYGEPPAEGPYRRRTVPAA